MLAFIRDQLLSGRVKVGDRLLAERDLATALGVSRPVVREALRSLAAIGAVDICPGQGTVVKQPSFSALADFFSFVLAQQSGALDDVMEVLGREHRREPRNVELDDQNAVGSAA